MSKPQPQDNVAQLVDVKTEDGSAPVDGNLVVEQLRQYIADSVVENAMLKARIIQLEAINEQLIGGPPKQAPGAPPVEQGRGAPPAVRGEGKPTDSN